MIHGIGGQFKKHLIWTVSASIILKTGNNSKLIRRELFLELCKGI
jgi:hypothetical protein